MSEEGSEFDKNLDETKDGIRKVLQIMYSLNGEVWENHTHTVIVKVVDSVKTPLQVRQLHSQIS